MTKYKLVPLEPTPEMLAATSWPNCAATDYRHMIAAAPAVQGEPVAYAVFAENGNIRIWSSDTIHGEALRQEYGDQVQALYAVQQPAGQDSEQDVTMLLGLLDDCLNSMRNAYPDYDHYESKAYIYRQWPSLKTARPVVDMANLALRGLSNE